MRSEPRAKLNSALTRPITSAMQPSLPASPTPADAADAAAAWRARVEDVQRRAVEHLDAGHLTALADLFTELDGWADEQRAYQARCRIAEATLAYKPLQAALWPPAFATTAQCLLDALEREPREPVLLNLTGVLLYELTENGGAEALFRAALRLDPGLDHVEANLAAARSRGPAQPPRGAVAVMLRTLGKRARSVAAKARTVEDMTLSLIMIVKDEQEMLPGCLEAVKDVVDEMVVVDTGSSDDTVAIAERFGAKVVHFPWNGSFADARNVSIDHATSDWVMYLDADEHLMPEDAPALRELIGRTWREAFYLVETNYTGGDDSGAAVTHHALRLWRRRPQYRFEGRIHEQKTHTMPTYLPERFETTTIRMRHYGYLRSRITAKDKSRRNIELLEIEARENPSPFNRYNRVEAFARSLAIWSWRTCSASMPLAAM
jgi:Glycosyl transferase family 2